MRFLNVSPQSVTVAHAGRTYTIAPGACGSLPDVLERAVCPPTSADGGLAGGRLVRLQPHQDRADAHAHARAVWAGAAAGDHRLVAAALDKAFPPPGSP